MGINTTSGEHHFYVDKGSNPLMATIYTKRGWLVLTSYQYLIQFSPERKLVKTKVKLINDNSILSVVSEADNAQIEANMNKVFSLIGEEDLVAAA